MPGFFKNINKKNYHFILLFGLLYLIFMSNSCTTSYTPPPNYVPDKEVVYLKQKTELRPIAYPAVMEEPYSWESDPVIDKKNPDFLKITSFTTITKPDINADAKLFLEVKEHLPYIKDNDAYLRLKQQLNNYEFIKPEPRKISKGKITETYTNGTEYEYPEIKGAKITYFKDGDYKIEMPKGSTYFYKNEGNYFENDPEGKELYAVFPKDGHFRVRENDIIYSYWLNDKRIETNHGAVKYHAEGKYPAQYQYYPDSKSENHYTFFIYNNSSEKSAIAYKNQYGIRFDFFSGGNHINVTYKNEAVTIKSNYQKIHSHYNQEEMKTEGLLSLYRPEGIQYQDLDKPLSYSRVNPNWPEDYKQIKIGPFSFLYTQKDKDLLSKINEKKLDSMYALATKITGLSCASWRTIILPPDLQSYRKLHAGDSPEKLLWYPSGFQGKDIIVMWPPSVPRYNLPEGEQYFWEEEFFEILIHELVHLFVGESTGLINQVPIWLNEGLAVYVETKYSPFSQKYWDTTFEAAFGMNKLLSWDSVTIHSTSFFEVAKARTHYAQSYKMTAFLIEKYGIKKVVDYVKSFKKIDEENEVPLDLAFQLNFNTIFAITWKENEENFRIFTKEEIKKRMDEDKK